jgi:hypothetical protein
MDFTTSTGADPSSECNEDTRSLGGESVTTQRISLSFELDKDSDEESKLMAVSLECPFRLKISNSLSNPSKRSSEELSMLIFLQSKNKKNELKLGFFSLSNSQDNNN